MYLCHGFVIICILAKPVSIFLTKAFKTSAKQECKKKLLAEKRTFSCIANQDEQRFIKSVRKMKIIIYFVLCCKHVEHFAYCRFYRETSKDCHKVHIHVRVIVYQVIKIKNKTCKAGYSHPTGVVYMEFYLATRPQTGKLAELNISDFSILKMFA